MDRTVEHRIAALSPQRNTRMGAAIRHAAKKIEATPTKTKMILVLSDGFPNDLDYKKDYAVEDTRKAVSEAYAAQIHLNALYYRQGWI